MKNSKSPIQFITTKDGSHTLWNEDLDETYHSRHGALQESLYVFIEMGLEPLLQRKDEIRIFEMGFGTGLNAWLTFDRMKDSHATLRYTGIEAFPLEQEIVASLNYAEQDRELFQKLHEVPWEQFNEIRPKQWLSKRKVKIEDMDETQTFDLIYYDAFGPNTQPDLWNAEVMNKCVRMMNPGAVFVTYCSKGQVRRDLRDAGLEMEKLPGPPGKREMLRGIKP